MLRSAFAIAGGALSDAIRSARFFHKATVHHGPGRRSLYTVWKKFNDPQAWKQHSKRGYCKPNYVKPNVAKGYR